MYDTQPQPPDQQQFAPPLTKDRLVQSGENKNLRGQLVHGAASRDGAINRESVQRCAEMLGYLLPAFLRVVIKHGVEIDWGPLCYPPIVIMEKA